MQYLLLICETMSIGVCMVNILRAMKNMEKEIMISNAFVAIGCFLICFSYASYPNFIMLSLTQINLNIVYFDFGLVFFFLGVFNMFIHLLMDPIFKYSPYVIIIGTSLLLMYYNIAISIG